MADAHLSSRLQEQVPGLIASIYEASLDSQRWSGFLEQVGTALQSPAQVIWANDFALRTVDLDGGFGSFASSRGFAEAELQSFAEYYCQRNVWLQEPGLHKAGKVVNSSALFADHQLPSKHTARSQFKSAAAKVGVGRQADFVRVLLTGPARLLWREQAAQHSYLSRA